MKLSDINFTTIGSIIGVVASLLGLTHYFLTKDDPPVVKEQVEIILELPDQYKAKISPVDNS